MILLQDWQYEEKYINITIVVSSGVIGQGKDAAEDFRFDWHVRIVSIDKFLLRMSSLLYSPTKAWKGTPCISNIIDHKRQKQSGGSPKFLDCCIVQLFKGILQNRKNYNEFLCNLHT